MANCGSDWTLVQICNSKSRQSKLTKYLYFQHWVGMTQLIYEIVNNFFERTALDVGCPWTLLGSYFLADTLVTSTPVKLHRINQQTIIFEMKTSIFLPTMHGFDRTREKQWCNFQKKFRIADKLCILNFRRTQLAPYSSRHRKASFSTE